MVTRMQLHQKMTGCKYRKEKRQIVMDYIIEQYNVIGKKQYHLPRYLIGFFNDYFRKWTQAKSHQKFEKVNADWLMEDFKIPEKWCNIDLTKQKCDAAEAINEVADLGESTVLDKRDAEEIVDAEEVEEKIPVNLEELSAVDNINAESVVADVNTEDPLAAEMEPIKKPVKQRLKKSNKQESTKVAKLKVRKVAKPKKTKKNSEKDGKQSPKNKKKAPAKRPDKSKKTNKSKAKKSPDETTEATEDDEMIKAPTKEKPKVSSKIQGRPRKSAIDCSERSLRRRSQVLREKHPLGLLAGALCTKLREERNYHAIHLIRACLADPDAAKKMLHRLTAPVVARVELPEIDSLTLLKKARLSKRQYIVIRKVTTPGVLAAYHRVVSLRDSMCCFDMEDKVINGTAAEMPDTIEEVATDTLTKVKIANDGVDPMHVEEKFNTEEVNNVDYENMFFSMNEFLVRKYPQVHCDMNSYQIQ